MSPIAQATRVHNSLGRAGITLSDYRPGQHHGTCPRCSAKRSKAQRRLPHRRGAVALDIEQSAIAEHPTPIRAELSGSNTASAAGITANGNAPVLALCRRLIEAAHDPTLPLEAYRGTTLCLRVRSIGEGAKLTVYEGTRGRPRFKLTGVLVHLDGRILRHVGPPIAQKPPGAVRYPPGDKSRPRPARRHPVAPNNLPEAAHG